MTQRQETFIPNLCKVQSVLGLILVGELLALAITTARFQLMYFDWLSFALTSMMVQWIMLTSAAVLCALRPFLHQKNSIWAASVSYAVVLVITVICSIVGGWVHTMSWQVNGSLLGAQIIISSIIAGVFFRYFYLQYQLRSQQRAELSARIDALQSRIRPHFLFNSMNSIASLIDIDPKQAEQMVLDVSTLFRASLKEDILVTLSQELDVCRRFVAIEQVRLGSRLNVNWQLDADVQHVQVPSLLLQPLLENAIYHGIEPLAQGGTIDVRVEGAQHSIVIVIENPISASVTPKANARHNGIALDNIRHRLTAIYGKQARFSTLTAEHRFLCKLTIPRENRERSS